MTEHGPGDDPLAAELMRLGAVTECDVEPRALLRYLREIAEAAADLGGEIDNRSPVVFEPDPKRTP